MSMFHTSWNFRTWSYTTEELSIDYMYVAFVVSSFSVLTAELINAERFLSTRIACYYWPSSLVLLLRFCGMIDNVKPILNQEGDSFLLIFALSFELPFWMNAFSCCLRTDLEMYDLCYDLWFIYSGRPAVIANISQQCNPINF